MGWDSADHWTTKKVVVEEQLAMYRRSDTFEVLDWKSTTNGLWLVVRNRHTGLKGIFFDLIEKHGKTYSVKSMDESMGPYYYDCPSKFLYAVPPRANESFMYNLTWRAQMQAVNGNKKGWGQPPFQVTP